MAFKLSNAIFLQIFFIFNCHADILLKNNEVTEEDFANYLGVQSELTAFKIFSQSESNFLEYPTIKLFSEWENEPIIDKKSALAIQIQNTLGTQFLSIQKRQLWIELLKLDGKSDKNNRENELQIGILTDKNHLFKTIPQRNYLKLTDYDLGSDEDIFINGWLIDTNERGRVLLDKKLLYHFFIASNSHLKVAGLDRPENFRPTYQDLVRGTCDRPIFNPKLNVKNERMFALFNKNCLAQLDYNRDNNIYQSKGLEDFESNANAKDWRHSKITYALIALGGIIIYNELKDYRVRITLPF